MIKLIVQECCVPFKFRVSITKWLDIPVELIQFKLKMPVLSCIHAGGYRLASKHLVNTGSGAYQKTQLPLK